MVNMSQDCTPDARARSKARSKMVLRHAPFQTRAAGWVRNAFGQAALDAPRERRQRFLEEALELFQACGGDAVEAVQILAYAYTRPAGQPVQEVGGVMLALAGLCSCHQIQMEHAGEVELARVQQDVALIRQKQLAKAATSGLPPSDYTPPTNGWEVG